MASSASSSSIPAFPNVIESGSITTELVTANDEGSLLAERKSRREMDREKRRKEFQSGTKNKIISPVLDIPNPLTAEGEMVTMSPDQILKRSFETNVPPGLGEPNKAIPGVISLERPFIRNWKNQGLFQELGLEHKQQTETSGLPDWVQKHPDFKRCIAKPLDLNDSKRRAEQLRFALRIPPEERPLSSVLLVAQWLVEFTDIDFEGVPRRNLMAMSRALYMRRIKKRGKAVYLAGEDPANVYIVMDGIAMQDSSVSSHQRYDNVTGTMLGPGRAFGLVSPLTIEEPRYDSVYNECFPWDLNRQEEGRSTSFYTSGVEGDGSTTKITSNSQKSTTPLLLAVIPLSTFFEEAAPGLSKRAESYRPYVCQHLSPSRTWMDSKHFVFGRQLRTRSFMAGDVVWRRGQPADCIAVVVDGNFVITREVAWSVTNIWPEGSSKDAPTSTTTRRRCRVREDGTTMVLETISNVFGNGDPSTKPITAGMVGGKKKITSQSKIGEVNMSEDDINVRVVVGEEPLLLVREDPNGIKHSFVDTRRYTLRAAGPGICTLIELPRNAVRRYLPFRGPWAGSVSRQAESRLISDEGVALAHRQRVAFEAASKTEWGDKMLAREKAYQIKQQWPDPNPPLSEGGAVGGHPLAHTSKILKGKDEWKERAKAMRKIPRSQQGQWGKSLDTPLPMLVAGVQGVQRG